jgi:hypothetical protein
VKNSCPNFVSIHDCQENVLRGENMAKSHYSFKKRKKEIERMLKQEQKRQRKFDKNSAESDEPFDKSQDEVDNSLT